MTADMSPSGDGQLEQPAGGAGFEATQPDTSSWRDTLPEDIRNSPSLTKFQDVNNLALGYLNAESMIGRDKIPMPKTDSEFADAFRRLGAPEKASDYGFDTAEFAESVVDADVYPESQLQADVNWFAEKALANNLTAAQAKGILKDYMEYQGGNIKAMSQAVTSETNRAEAALRQSWGEAYDSNIRIVERTLGKIWPGDTAKAIIASGLGRNPEFLKGVHKLGSSTLEEIGIDKGDPASHTPDSLQREMSALMAKPAYLDSSNPEHQMTVEAVRNLMERLYPDAR